jgi:hypothetical protein
MKIMVTYLPANLRVALDRRVATRMRRTCKLTVVRAYASQHEWCAYDGVAVHAASRAPLNKSLERAKTSMRVLVTGAAGSGTTTLGRALSGELKIAFFDVDDYFWLPTEPPYQQKRNRSARFSLLVADLAKAPSATLVVTNPP